MDFYFNPLDDACKSVVGAVREGTKLKLQVYTDLPSLKLYIADDFRGVEMAYPMEKTEGGFFAYLNLRVGLYWYHFVCNDVRYGRGEDFTAKAYSFSNYQLTIYRKDYVAPNAITGGLIYQIFPDRFCKVGDFEVEKGKVKRTDWGGEPTFRSPDGEVKNNEFFGGNFKGIKEKLPYLKELGVTTVYLNPIVKAYSSHRYDTGDYLAIDPVLGSEDDLVELLSAAKDMGINFIFDGVYNHTGADSLYFNKFGTYDQKGAYNSKNSKFYKWYTFKDYPNKYESWWDFPTLPSIKKHSVSFQRFITDVVLKKYFEMGFAGVRLDVVDELGEEFVVKINKAAKAYSKDNIVIGEVWEDATNKIAYGERRKYYLGNELDSVMNYPLKDAIVSYILHADTADLVRVFCEQVNNFSADALNNLMNVLSSHDTARLITVFGRDKVVLNKDLLKYEKLDAEQYERGKRYAKLAYAIAFTCYGVPSVYYGDEVGLTGDLDPYNRRCFPWGNEDADMLDFMKYLSKVRKASDAVKYGKFDIAYFDKSVIVYSKTYKDEQVIVAVSRKESAVKLSFEREFTEFFGSAYKKEFELPSDGLLILKAKNV